MFKTWPAWFNTVISYFIQICFPTRTQIFIWTAWNVDGAVVWSSHSLLKPTCLPWINDTHASKEANGKGKSLIRVNFKDTQRFKAKEWRKVFHENGNEKRTMVAILVTEKIDFMPKMRKRSIPSMHTFPFSLHWLLKLNFLGSDNCRLKHSHKTKDIDSLNSFPVFLSSWQGLSQSEKVLMFDED